MLVVENYVTTPLPSLPSVVETREAVENSSPFPEARQSNIRDTGYSVVPLVSFSSLYYEVVYMFLV
jgi:hypothetical protein